MYFVLCYPTLPAADAEAVEAFRRRHEPARARLVRAHITLVFGVSSLTADAMAKLAAGIAAASPPFDFAFDGMEVEAHEKGDHNLMLKVGEGADKFVALHRAFYAGALASERRRDIEFVPHMTIASNAELEAVVTCAPEAKPLSRIKGRVDFLDVATLSDGALHPVATVALGQ